MTEFNEGWWNCFCSFANELANTSSSASMVIRAVLDGAGVTKKEINDIIKSQHLDKRVIEELKEYKEGGLTYGRRKIQDVQAVHA